MLGLELNTLSHAQLDAVEEVHQAIVRSITESRITLEADREKMLVEEAVSSSRDLAVGLRGCAANLPMFQALRTRELQQQRASTKMVDAGTARRSCCVDPRVLAAETADDYGSWC
eukprot:COSAG05_NODE_1020_length_6147_cov_4.104828_2_plen_115_part_00